MRLRKIEIENFKGISSRQTIELKPITLLFGPNSAGKSTILQSLQYVREVLERDNANADHTIGGGEMDLGGFANFVNDHDTSKKVKIKLVIDLDDSSENEYLPLNSENKSKPNPIKRGLNINYCLGDSVQYASIETVVKSIGLEIQTSWSEFHGTAYLSKINIEMNDEHICSVRANDPTNSSEITNFNFDHPLLKNSLDDEEEENDSELALALLNCSKALASNSGGYRSIFYFS